MQIKYALITNWNIIFKNSLYVNIEINREWQQMFMFEQIINRIAYYVALLSASGLKFRKFKTKQNETTIHPHPPPKKRRKNTPSNNNNNNKNKTKHTKIHFFYLASVDRDRSRITKAVTSLLWFAL